MGSPADNISGMELEVPLHQPTSNEKGVATADARENCFPKSEGYDELRFALVMWVGTPIAVLGIFSNTVLIKLFSNRKRLQSPTLYLFVLAILDALICTIYVPFFTIDAIAIYYVEEHLYRLWHSYAMLLYGVSRVVQFASTYMVVCATFERFVVVARIDCFACMSRGRGRLATIGGALLFVLALRLPAFMDYHVEHNGQCPPFEDYFFTPWLMAREDYAQFNFYVIGILHILLPFLVLLSLNLVIVVMMRRRLTTPHRRRFVPPGHQFRHMPTYPRLSRLIRRESLNSVNRQQRNELRYATRTMVLVTFTYLLCNVFNVLITVMESAFKNDGWMVNEDGTSTKFYTYTADLTSLLVTVNSFARFAVYFFGNPEFRSNLISLTRAAMNNCAEATPKEPLSSAPRRERVEIEKGSKINAPHGMTPARSASEDTLYV